MSDSGASAHKTIKLADNDESHQKKTGDCNGNEITAFRSPLTDPMLPPEKWDLIFSSLTSNDFLSVINACVEWNELLHSRKTSELFALVLPHLLPYLNANEILGCRLVSTSCQAAVDLALQTIWTSSDSAPNFPRGRTTQLYSTVEGLSKNYVFGPTLEPQITQFMRALNLRERNPQSRNPFLIRSLEVEWPFSLVERQPDFKHRLRNLLFRYGNHLWRLKYKYVHVFNVTMLSEYLSLLPQLKVLELSNDFGPEPILTRDNFRLPTLSNLEHLDTTGLRQHSITTFFVDWYGPQVRSLAVHGSWFGAFHSEGGALSFFLLPKLKKLQVIDAVPSTLSILSRMDWPLETLQLQLRAFGSQLTGAEKVQLIVETVSKFKDSLITLELHVERGGSVEPDTGLEEDIVAVAFAKLNKLEKVVFWTKKGNQDFSKYVMKRNNLK